MNSDSNDEWSNEPSALLLRTPAQRTTFDPPSAQFFNHLVDGDTTPDVYREPNAFEIAQVAAQLSGDHPYTDNSIAYSLFDDIDSIQAWALQHSATDAVPNEDTDAPRVREASQPLVKRHTLNQPIGVPLTHSTPKYRKYSQYDYVHKRAICPPIDAVITPANVRTPEQKLSKPDNLESHPSNLRLFGEQRRLHLVFLPAQKDTAEGTIKYAKVAEIIQLKDGMLKLFVERGRVIETRISVTPSTDLDLSNCQSLRIRLLPYSSLGGVRRPVVGHENAIHPGHFSQIRQLCFVQLSDGSCHNYQIDENGYQYVETPLLGACTIHQLVFPFLNSQCPTARRTEVYVRVTVIRSDGSEVCGTTFQVVSCASPYRDANRFRQRHYNGDSLSFDAHTGPSEVDAGARGNLGSDFRTQNAARSELDISPSSSGFVSWCSPGTTGIHEDDSMPTIDAILNEHQSRELPPSCNGYHHSEGCCPHSSSDGDEAESALEQNAFFGQLGSLEDSGTHFTAGAKRVICDSSGHSTPFKRMVHPHQKGNCTNQRASSFGSIRSSGEDNDQACEYVIKTKSRRVYEILFTLHAKLTETFGDV